MHFRRLASLLVGAWLMGCLFMDLVAIQNFRSVDRLLSAPSAQAASPIRAMGGHDPARAFLRYQVAEQNRWYFENWERMQIALGLVLLLVLLFGSVPDRVALGLTLIMLASVPGDAFLSDAGDHAARPFHRLYSARRAIERACIVLEISRRVFGHGAGEAGARNCAGGTASAQKEAARGRRERCRRHVPVSAHPGA